MSSIVFGNAFTKELETLNHEIKALNAKKARLLLEHLPLHLDAAILDMLLGWDTVTVHVPDKGMCAQLNRLSETDPRLRFKIDRNSATFSVDGLK
jgi:hypothetical protein